MSPYLKSVYRAEMRCLLGQSLPRNLMPGYVLCIVCRFENVGEVGECIISAFVSRLYVLLLQLWSAC